MHRRTLPWVAVLVLLAALLALGGACSQDLEPAQLPAAVDAARRNELLGASRERVAKSLASSDVDGEDETEDAPAAEPRPPAVLVVHVVGREDARPIAGATVRHVYADDAHVATTDVEGNATLRVPRTTDDADDGDEWFEVSAQGCVRDNLFVALPSGTEQRATVHLAPGYAFEGSVRDAAGRPIAGARIAAATGGVCVTPLPIVAETTTDAAGQFRLDGVSFWVDSEITISDGRHVALRRWRSPGDRDRFDVVLRDGGTLRGLVRAPDGTPVSWAEVRLEVCDEDALGDAALPRGDLDGAFVTRDDGSFEIAGLPFDVPFTLSAHCGGFMDSDFVHCEQLTEEQPHRALEIDLREVATVVLDLDFAEPHAPSTAHVPSPYGVSDGPGYPVPGRATFVVTAPGEWTNSLLVPGMRPVTVRTNVAPGETQHLSVRFDEGASLSGVVQDDTGVPIGGAEVVVDSNRPWPQRTVSASDGSFEFRALTVGPHTVEASARGHADASLDDVTAPGKDIRCVVSRYGEAVLRLELPTGSEWPAGRRITWNDYPVYVEDEGPWTGAPIVSFLPPGDYLLEVHVNGFVHWELRGVEVRAGKRTDLGEIPLEAGLRIRGRIVDPDGRALSREVIWCGDQIVTTDADGRFVSPPLAPGPQQVRARFVDGMVDANVSIDLAEDSPPLEIRMIRGALLRVTLTGVSAEETESLYVELVTGGTDGLSEVRHDIDDLDEPSTFAGRFGPLRGRVEVTRDDEVVATREVELRDGQDMTIEVAVPR